MNNEINFYLEQIDLLNEGVLRNLETWWFGPIMTGEYDQLKKKLLKMAETAQNIGEVEYLIKDCDASISVMKGFIKRMKNAQDEINKGQKPSDKQAYKMIKHGNTPEKMQEYCNWCNTTYKVALNKRKKELLNK